MLLLYEVFFSALVEQYALLIQHNPLRKPWFVCDSSRHNACLGHRFFMFLGKVDTEDWLVLCKWVHVSLWEGCAAGRSQGEDLPLCIPISRLQTQRCQPLCQLLTASQFIALLQISYPRQEKSHRQPSEVSNFSLFPGFYLGFLK